MERLIKGLRLGYLLIYLMILVHDLQLHFSNIPPGHHSESNPHSQADHCRWDSPVLTSAPWSYPVHPRPRCSWWIFFLPSQSNSSTHPVSMLNLQVLSSYFMFVSFLPYGTLAVVCRAFLWQSLGRFSMEARDSFCFPKNTKNPNPSPIGKKFGFCCCGAPPGTRTLGPLIKRASRRFVSIYGSFDSPSFLIKTTWFFTR